MKEHLRLVRRDLLIYEEMALEMPAYLRSEVQRWTMERADLPRLTIGGFLMREHRLMAVLSCLEPTEQALCRLAGKRMEKLFAQQPVRFERRAHQELRARMGEWMNHLRNWHAAGVLRAADFAREADTRVVIAALIARLRLPPFRLDPQLPEQLEAVDRFLQTCWHEGEFIWPLVWAEAYPPETYWWLYGNPDCQLEREGQFRMEIPTLTPIS